LGDGGVILKLGVVLLAVLSSQLSYGSDFQSPRTSALGGAGHAGPFLTDAVYMNPSYLPKVPFYAMGFNYVGYTPGTFTNPGGGPQGDNYNFTVMASSHDLPVQFGAGYTRRDDGTLVHFAASFSAGERLSFGVGSKFLTTPSGNLVASPDVSLSVSAIFSDRLRLAFIADNFLESFASSGFYREYVLGSKFQLNSNVALYADPHLSADSVTGDQIFGIEAGAEVRLFEYLFLRGGGFSHSTLPFQARKGSGAAFGVGLTFPKVSIDYAFSRVTVPESGVFHNVGLSLFF
jgi:hypothetical protein